MKTLNDTSAIKSKKDFLHFLDLLIKDFEEHREQWTNTDIRSYFEAMQSWVEDMDGYYENFNLPIPTDIPWHNFADILLAAKVYEA